MKIARLRSLAIALLAISFSVGCAVYSPDPGHEIVLVEKPIILGHGGVDPTPVKTGRSIVAFTTEGIDVYVQPKKYEEEMHDTMTKDGVPISFHVIMTLQVTNSVAMIKNFGPDWFANNIQEPWKTIVRQAVRKYGMNETAISTVALDAIDDEITTAVNKLIADKKIPAQLITMTVGRANPPDSVKNQRIETATQEQRIQTEQQKKKAEDMRLAAETARAAADNAYREAMHLSPEQYIALESIKMQQEVCGTNGKANCTFIANGVHPVYNLSGK
jgi:regulator of protease activity HflC (stomatin/prohibitin superfamily)